MPNRFDQFKTSLADRFNEAPETVILAGAAIIGASAKLISATSGIKSRNAYAKSMNRRRR